MALNENSAHGANPAPGYRFHPEHQVSVELFRGLVSIQFENAPIASSRYAVTVRETGHPEVFYLPPEDVDDQYLIENNRVTRCPFKGKARYWNLKVGNHEIDNAAWSYEMPYDEALELAGMIAFYESKVEITAQADG